MFSLTQLLTRLAPHRASWSNHRLRPVVRFLFSIFLVLSVLALIIGATASQTASAAPPNSQFEVNITNNGANSTMGEPEIAQNPRNPNELFMDWTTFSNPPGRPVPGVTLASPPSPPCPPNARPTFGLCLVAHGYDAIVRSTDGGQTWSAPVKIMGTNDAADGPFPFAPGSGNPSDTFDRPWLSVDRSTGVIYAASHNIVDHETFVTASTNDGQSFGTIYAADTAHPSNGLPSGTIAAANGELGVAYTAASVPGHTCPCAVFETTTDQGATFTPHFVPLVGAARVPRAFVAADPVGNERFALTVLDSAGTENQVYTTTDNGQSWRGPATVGDAPPNPRFKPWLTYGPSGLLALVWRTQNSNGSYDVWAATGRNEGANGPVFSSPVRVTSASGTYPTTNPTGAGDDFSWVIADNQSVHVGWGDSRNVSNGGGVQVFYSRIPLTTFKGQG